MEFIRTTVRPDRLSAMGLDAMTASALASALVRGEVMGSCDYCGRVLYERDERISLEEWSMSLGHTVDATMCRECKDSNDDC